MMSVAIAVQSDPVHLDACQKLAQQLSLPLVPPTSLAQPDVSYDLALAFIDQRLSLCRLGPNAPGPVCVDFADNVMQYRRRAGHNELIGRAIGVGKRSPLRVIDATAGLGTDSYVMADLGCEVVLCERSPIVVELLRDGIARASLHGDARVRDTAARLECIAGDSGELSTDVLDNVDVIYLDPMFPARNKSAQVKKSMQLLQQLPGTTDAGEQLMDWALLADVARVVVKRPLRAPPLAQRKPSHSIRGKAVRFDVYVKRAL